jgi:hypothetical protein
MALKPEKSSPDKVTVIVDGGYIDNNTGLYVKYVSRDWQFVPECISHSFSPEGYQEGYQTRKTIQ